MPTQTQKKDRIIRSWADLAKLGEQHRDGCIVKFPAYGALLRGGRRVRD